MDGFLWFMLCAVGLVIVGVLFVGVQTILGGFVPTAWEPHSSYKLTSLQLHDTINGVFVWGSGTIGGRMTYRSMLVHKDGKMSPFTHEVTNDNTTIREDESTQGEGRITIVHEVAVRTKWWTRWAIVDTSRQHKYEYIVPKGTVRNQFTVN